MQRSTRLLSAEIIDVIEIANLVDWRTHLAGLRRRRGACDMLEITQRLADCQI
jgi:hypothetical protein